MGKPKMQGFFLLFEMTFFTKRSLDTDFAAHGIEAQDI